LRPADSKASPVTVLSAHSILCRRVPSAVLPAALLMALLLSLQSRVGDATVGALSSAELLQSAASTVRYPGVHRLRGAGVSSGVTIVT